MHEHTQICRGLRLADSKHCIHSESFLITQTQYITLKSAFFVVFLVEDSHAGSLLYFRCCFLAPMFSTKHVCRHLRGFQGENAARCAERSNMRHVWSTMQHNSLDTSVPPGKLITSIRFVRVTPVLSPQLYKASVSRIQAYWRGYASRKRFAILRKYSSPQDKHQRRKFFEDKVSFECEVHWSHLRRVLVLSLIIL